MKGGDWDATVGHRRILAPRSRRSTYVTCSRGSSREIGTPGMAGQLQRAAVGERSRDRGPIQPHG